MMARWGTSRTEAFSDGVLAIAITLLVLEISVPSTAFDDLWQGIADEWPSYLAYATSFLTIGAIWLGHHGIFRRLRWIDARVMRVNLLLLMAVAFLPFPTTLMAEAIHDSDAERAATIFYGASLLVVSGLLALLWRVASGDRALLEPDVTEADVRAVTRATTPSLGFYGAVTVVAIVAPVVAAVGFLVVAVLGVARAMGDPPSATSIDEAA